MTTIGLDIGGANLKAVLLPDQKNETSHAVEVPFPMWTHWKELSTAIGDIIHQVDPDTMHRRIAVTMTGELADCFSSKKQGVVHIAESVGKMAGAKPISFYQTDGNWSDCDSAAENWQLLAASNWHAMARMGAQYLPHQTGLIFDVGSTTTDVIPVVDGEPRAMGTNDFTRLKNHELIYAGVGRTPICGLIQSVDVSGQKTGLARELFATTSDALIYLGMLPEDATDNNSADGRSNSKGDAIHRLARMVCSDVAEVENCVIDQIANKAIEAYRNLLVEAVDSAIQKSENSIESALLVGSGSFFAERVLASQFPELTRVRLSEVLSQSANICGPAYAVAALLSDFH